MRNLCRESGKMTAKVQALSPGNGRNVTKHPHKIISMNWSLATGCGRCRRALTSLASDLDETVMAPFSGQKNMIEARWRQFFSDPLQWWDHRSEKTSARFPDFTNKQTREALWLNGRLNPEWVESKLVAMGPGPVQRSLISWNTLLARHVKNQEDQKTLECFQQLQQEGMVPDTFTFVQVLKACANLKAVEEGSHIHTLILQSGCESDVFVGGSLIDMYAKCGNIEDAQRVFNKMHRRDLVVWTAMMKGYVKCGQGNKALYLYRKMQDGRVRPDPVTFVAILNACASMFALQEGKRVHAQVIESGCEAHPFVVSSLVDMYAKCGSIDDAWSVFSKIPTRDVVSWNALILGYSKCGHGQRALQLYQQMQANQVTPNRITFMGVLNACASISALEDGRQIHNQIIRSDCEFDVFISSSLVDMYAKCGSIEEARSVFSKMHTRDVASWNAMILGYVKCGQAQNAIELFQQMQAEQVEPDYITFVGILNACASIVALEKGKFIHGQIDQSRWGSDIFVRNAVIDMYAKCGSLEDARKVFDATPRRDVVCWSTMLGGYSMHGRGTEALGLFERMQQEGIEINGVTFVGLLSACSYGGLVEEGLYFFKCMGPVYSVPATLDHYTCLIDLLGRTGSVHEAEEVIKTMPFEPDVTVWKALLSACLVHGNVEVGRRIAPHVLELDPQNASGYVMLSNIYSSSGEWDKSATIQRLRIERGVDKQPASAWIVVDDQVHAFLVDDQGHPQLTEINAELKRLFREMEDSGYVPDTGFMLHDVEDGEKKGRLFYHNEELAIAYGLISTRAGTPIRIFTNSRVCGDCHSSTKFIAKIVGREIAIKDANRFHHFKDGVCSCGDYW